MIDDLSALFLHDPKPLSLHKDASVPPVPPVPPYDAYNSYDAYELCDSKQPSTADAKPDSKALSALSAPASRSLEIWAKKIFYLSEDLQKLVQMNAERYLERHSQLEALAKALRSDFCVWLESAREEQRARHVEGL